MKETKSIKEVLSHHLSTGGFHEALKLELLEVQEDEGVVLIRAPFQPLHERGPNSGQGHGGPISAIVDIAADFAIFARVGYGVPTADLRIDFLRPAIETDLLARGKVIKAGKTLAVADVEVTDKNDRIVALGRGTYVTAR